MSRFLEKWLRDVRSEQNPGGSFPNTVPNQGYGFPTTMPPIAVDWWDDACVLVPWAEYQARGDLELLREMYPAMKRYLKACRFWAGLGSFGKHRYLWNTPPVLHFGDWVAPDVPKMSQWQGRAKWTATASLRNTTALVSKIAALLGEEAEAQRYQAYSDAVADAYVSLLTDGRGRLKNEFQTGYVLPLYLDMFPDEGTRQAAADRLAELVGLNNQDVDFTTNQLKVTGKRDKQRVIPFGKELKQVLTEYIRLRDEQPMKLEEALILNDKGRRIARGQVQSIVKQYLSMVTTMSKRSPHVLRHSFATAMLNNGAELESVRQLLGHESVATTEIYTHTTFEQLKRVYENAHPRA